VDAGEEDKDKFAGKKIIDLVPRFRSS